MRRTLYSQSAVAIFFGVWSKCWWAWKIARFFLNLIRHRLDKNLVSGMLKYWCTFHLWRRCMKLHVFFYATTSNCIRIISSPPSSFGGACSQSLSETTPTCLWGKETKGRRKFIVAKQKPPNQIFASQDFTTCQISEVWQGFTVDLASRVRNACYCAGKRGSADSDLSSAFSPRSSLATTAEGSPPTAKAGTVVTSSRASKRR